MTFEVEYESILSRELHIKIHDVTRMPIVIEHPMITKLHTIENNWLEVKYSFKIVPQEAQGSDWNWETENGRLVFHGTLNEMFVPCEIDLWLIG